MRIVPGEEEVNFERVTKVYREESGKKTLVALEADFYDKLASYIARLDESANKEAQKDPNSPKALLLQDELRKVRKRRDQIFTYRERKLALLASSRASGAEVEVPNLPAQERGLFDGMVALLGKSAEPQGPRPRPRTRGPAPVCGNRYDVPVEKRGRGDAPEDDRGDPCRPRESKDRPNGWWPTVTAPTEVHRSRFGVIVLAAFAIGLPVIVVIAIGNGPIWPIVPILVGSWVIVMLIVRAVVGYKIYTSTFRKQRDIAGQEISRLEARIDEVQRKSGDKN